MNRLCRRTSSFLLALLCLNPAANQPEARKAMTEVVWAIDNLKRIGEKTVTLLGAPKIIETPRGRALEFDGKQDGLLVAAQPLAGFDTFTAEVIFRPDADGPREQRFLHLQENDSENRVLIETRLREDGLWFLDTYIRSGRTDETLFAEKFTHPVGKWYQAALVFDGSEMRHYVNGVKELSSRIAFSSLRDGRTSIGVRINQVHWFKGAIRTIRFTSRPLQPGEFLKP
jgi:concanavalin A-like lectin/glucanase superfamily protein